MFYVLQLKPKKQMLDFIIRLITNNKTDTDRLNDAEAIIEKIILSVDIENPIVEELNGYTRVFKNARAYLENPSQFEVSDVIGEVIEEAEKKQPIANTNKYPDFCVFLDAGHGGISPDGAYTTAPSKMYHFTDYNITIYEGDINRKIANKTYDILKEKGINVIKVYHEYKDTPLQERVSIANKEAKKYKDSVFVSLHSNATGNSNNGVSLSANGWDVYIAPVINKTQKLPTRYFLAKAFEDAKKEVIEKSNTNINFRIAGVFGNTTIKEGRFTVLTQTSMPSVLVENLFFTNISDAQKLLSEEYQGISAESNAKGIQQYLDKYYQ